MTLRALVTLLFIGLCGVAVSNASTLGPIPLDCGGFICGALDVGTNSDSSGCARGRGDISATFTAIPGLLDALACCGHFNWLNIVTAGTTDSSPREANDTSNIAAFPLIDPASRGDFGFAYDSPRDGLPFYYNETSDRGRNSLSTATGGGRA